MSGIPRADGRGRQPKQHIHDWQATRGSDDFCRICGLRRTAAQRRRETVERTETAITQAAENADGRWIDTALEAGIAIAENPADYPAPFGTDELWRRLEAYDVDPPHERRAIAGVVRHLVAAGYWVPTGEYRPSDRPEAHGHPKRVYERKENR